MCSWPDGLLAPLAETIIMIIMMMGAQLGVDHALNALDTPSGGQARPLGPHEDCTGF